MIIAIFGHFKPFYTPVRLAVRLNATAPSSRPRDHALQKPSISSGSFISVLVRDTFSREKGANFRRCSRLLQVLCGRC